MTRQTQGTAFMEVSSDYMENEMYLKQFPEAVRLTLLEKCQNIIQAIYSNSRFYNYIWVRKFSIKEKTNGKSSDGGNAFRLSE
jgi:hypothetical protein